MKSKLDSEIKMELLIKLAFGLSVEDLAKEYNLTNTKIINLRKNNYLKYNEFFDHWRIDKEVAILCLPAKYERALSVVKKFYKSKIDIKSSEEIYFNGKFCTFLDIIDLADKILKLDNINNFKDPNLFIKNHY